MIGLKLFEKSEVGILKDPFQKECIQNVYISYWPAHNVKWAGSIKFVNDNTLGEQKFSSDSYGGLLAQMSAFLEALR